MSKAHDKTLEKSVCHWLREGMKDHYPLRYRFERIETGATAAGIPDITFAFEMMRTPASFPAVEGWIETKSVALPVRMTTRVLGPKDGLSKEQINFHYFSNKIRGRSFIFVRAGEYKWLVSNRYAEQVNDFSRDDFDSYAELGICGPWGGSAWRALISILTGPLPK